MRLGCVEIKRRASAFSEEWKEAHREWGETRFLYRNLSDILDIKRRCVATYGQRVKPPDNKFAVMDLHWSRTLLVQQKSTRLVDPLAATGAQANRRAARRVRKVSGADA